MGAAKEDDDGNDEEVDKLVCKSWKMKDQFAHLSPKFVKAGLVKSCGKRMGAKVRECQEKNKTTEEALKCTYDIKQDPSELREAFPAACSTSIRRCLKGRVGEPGENGNNPGEGEEGKPKQKRVQLGAAKKDDGNDEKVDKLVCKSWKMPNSYEHLSPKFVKASLVKSCGKRIAAKVRECQEKNKTTKEALKCSYDIKQNPSELREALSSFCSESIRRCLKGRVGEPGENGNNPGEGEKGKPKQVKKRVQLGAAKKDDGKDEDAAKEDDDGNDEEVDKLVCKS